MAKIFLFPIYADQLRFFLSTAVDKIVDNNIDISNMLDILKEKIRDKISDLNYNTWFCQVEGARIDNNNFVIEVPNKFVANWIEDYYKDIIIKAVNDEGHQIEGLLFQITNSDKAPAELTNNKQPECNVSPIADTVKPLPMHVHSQSTNQSGLNPKLTFEKFVVGSSNQFAHAASKAVADLPGGKYNPLYIYGGVGLGKTHLMNAIGLSIKEKYPDLYVIYTTGERFMNELICAIRFERMPEFRKKYRDKCHILLIDDIQFIAGKERTQDEFFHTFNILHDSQRQLIFTSDRSPREIKGIEERIRSRFESGLIADIAPPDLETRIAILQKKAEDEGLSCPLDVAIFLATNIKNNVRELEGSLIRLNAFSSLTGAKITVDFAKEVLKNILPVSEKRIGIEDVQKIVANFYNITTNDITSTSRIKTLAYPRQIAMFLCKKHLRSSFPEIGGKFGGKDHSTVMHACKKIERLLTEDEKLQLDMNSLEKVLLG